MRDLVHLTGRRAGERKQRVGGARPEAAGSLTGSSAARPVLLKLVALAVGAAVVAVVLDFIGGPGEEIAEAATSLLLGAAFLS